MNAVRVTRNPTRSSRQPWLVQCTYCDNGGGGFLGALFAKPLGWTSDWRAAQDFAHRHALEHERTRCVTCLHVPESAVPSTPAKESA